MYEAYHIPEDSNSQRYCRVILYCNFYVWKPGKLNILKGVKINIFHI